MKKFLLSLLLLVPCQLVFSDKVCGRNDSEVLMLSDDEVLNRIMDLGLNGNNKDIVLNATRTMIESMGQNCNRNVDPEKLNKAMNVVAETYEEFAPAMIEKAKEIYKDIFTSDELRELLRFYESDLGKKLINKLPEISTRFMPVAIEMQNKLMSKCKNECPFLASATQCSELDCSERKCCSMKENNN